MTTVRAVRAVRVNVAAALWAIALIATTGCASSAARTSSSATSSSRPTPTTRPTPTSRGPATTSSVPACTSTGEIDAWPAARRAAQLVVLPSLNFNVAGLAPLIRAGAGGVLFLGNDATPPDLAQRLAAVTSGRAPGAKPLVMADVEGGGVQRLPGAVDAFPWPRELAASRSAGSVQSLAETVGREMLDAGVNVDLAPVVDLDDRPGPSATNPDGLRSFSVDPNVASTYGVAFMQGLRSAGVIPVLKHFPGIGGSTENTDFGAAATLPYSDLQNGGLEPFITAIAAKAPAIMVSNAYVPGLTTRPASVSTAVIQNLLRDRLGFRGLVVTDSLSAGAIRNAGYTVPQAAVASIEAGADLVLFGSTLTPADTTLLSPANVAITRDAIINALTTAVRTGALTPKRLDAAVAHVLAAKGTAVCGR